MASAKVMACLMDGVPCWCAGRYVLTWMPQDPAAAPGFGDWGNVQHGYAP